MHDLSETNGDPSIPMRGSTAEPWSNAPAPQLSAAKGEGARSGPSKARDQGVILAPSSLAVEGRGAGSSDPGSTWPPTLADDLVEAMADDWRRGLRSTAEEILAGHPGLDDESAVRLVYEEACLRRESGLEVVTSEVVRRFPRWGAELEVMLRCDRLMRPMAAAHLPEIGERLGDFDLLAELGRGASGRTFLASQSALADRPVVLKVMPGHLDEHLSLASLQHTHIVPLYSAQPFPDRGLRGLCMPYLGGSSLARLLDELAPIEPARRAGRDLLEALDRSGRGRSAGPASPSASRSPTPTPGPFRRSLGRATYVQAICWVGSCLADALQYAHERGLVHMDVKPSNVLIAGDGQPMLLDFHLARGPVLPGDDRPGSAGGTGHLERLGGTPGWMSPEQSAAMGAIRQGRPVEAGVDGRADVYSLGLLIYQALGGPVPRPEGAAGPRLDRVNPRVSVGLADVVEKCLRRDPRDRYEGPGALADDLRRHLDDRPLQGVPNRSIAERWRKWRRRRPQALARGSAGLSTLAAAVLVLAVAGESYRHRLAEVDEAIGDARRLRAAGQFAESLRSLERGVELARPLLAVAGRDEVLDEQLRLSIRGVKSRGLHDLANLLRFRYGSGPPAPEDSDLLERRCRRVWGERGDLDDPVAGRLDEATERQIGEDLAELARAVGEPTASPSPGSARAHRELGRSLLRDGRFDAASREFRAALDLDPRDFWANFHQGVCDYRLARFDDALAAFRTCVALSPSTAECYFNRALALEALGKPDLASLDYAKALGRDPALAAASLNRGILAYKAGRPRDALDDFRRALRSSPGRAMVGTLRYNMALAQIALDEKTEARASLLEASRLGHLEARALLDRLKL